MSNHYYSFPQWILLFLCIILLTIGLHVLYIRFLNWVVNKIRKRFEGHWFHIWLENVMAAARNGDVMSPTWLTFSFAASFILYWVLF